MVQVQASAEDSQNGGVMPIINSTEQILLQGDKSKKWRIEFSPPPPLPAALSMQVGMNP